MQHTRRFWREVRGWLYLLAFLLLCAVIAYKFQPVVFNVTIKSGALERPRPDRSTSKVYGLLASAEDDIRLTLYPKVQVWSREVTVLASIYTPEHPDNAVVSLTWYQDPGEAHSSSWQWSRIQETRYLRRLRPGMLYARATITRARWDPKKRKWETAVIAREEVAEIRG